MKRKLPKRSGIAALVLLAGALGVLAWQGSRHLTAVSGNTPARLAAVSETVTDTGTLPAEESALPETSAETTPLMPLPLDLNRAGEEDLMQLPDMQPALAAEIVAFRERITAFSSVYELLYVDGMTEAYFTEIRDSVQIYGDIAPE